MVIIACVVLLSTVLGVGICDGEANSLISSADVELNALYCE